MLLSRVVHHDHLCMISSWKCLFVQFRNYQLTVSCGTLHLTMGKKGKRQTSGKQRLSAPCCSVGCNNSSVDMDVLLACQKIFERKSQCSPFQMVNGKIFRLQWHLLPSKMPMGCWKCDWEKNKFIYIHFTKLWCLY